jgi:hypothetical protein
VTTTDELRRANRPPDAAVDHVTARLNEIEFHSRQLASQVIAWRRAAHCWRKRYRSVLGYSVLVTAALAVSLIAHMVR